MKYVGLISSVVLYALLGLAIAPQIVEAQSYPPTSTIDGSFHHGEDAAVTRGRIAFFQRDLRKLGGNDRACADCHMPFQEFQLSPASAKARFDYLQWVRRFFPKADDPLFRPVDADDFRVNGDKAKDFSNLVQNGLVRVTMPLPPNVKLIDPATGQPSDETWVDLWRAVMPLRNVAITGPDNVLPIWPPAPRVPIGGVDANGPNRQGGYQHDARFSTLQEQARGALFAHAQVKVEPPASMLDDLAAFQQTLFTSPGVKQLADAILSGSSSFPDPDPELNALEQRGKQVFIRACAQCHGGTLHPSTSTPDATLVRPIVRYHNIQTACPRPVTDGFAPCPDRLARNARTYLITLADGNTTQTFTTDDPGRLLLTGQIADLGVLDSTNLHGISKTAPYFHNNSAATLAEVIDHYVALFKRAARLSPPPNLPPIISSNGVDLDRGFISDDEREALLAYLHKL
jgi:cytochrome c peroxidase